MRLRPGFLKPSSSSGSRNASDASPTSAAGGGGGDDDNGGATKVPDSSSSSSHPALLPPRSRRGKSNSDARMSSSTTSQTSVASLLSLRGALSPTTTPADLGGNNDRGSGGSGGSSGSSNRRRAFTAPAKGGGGGLDSSRPASRYWGRRRRRRSGDATGTGGGEAAAGSGSSEMVVVAAVDLADDERLGGFARGGGGVLGAPRTILSGNRGAGFDEAIDLDDEELTQRKRGDGDGVSTDEDDDIDDESGGVLGKPSPGPWSDGLLAHPSGVGFFPTGASPPPPPASVGISSGTPAAICERYGSFPPRALPGAQASPTAAAAAALDSEAADGRLRYRPLSAAAAAARPPDVELRPQARTRAPPWRGQKAAQLAGEKDEEDGTEAWPSRRPAGGEGGSWWVSPTTPGEEGSGGRWPSRHGGVSSGDGGVAGDDRRWSSASSLNAPAVASSAPDPLLPPPPRPSSSAAAAPEAFLPAAAEACLPEVVGSSSDRVLEGRGTFQRGVEAHAASVAPPGEEVGAESPRLLMESSFFCRENGTEELRTVLGSPDLRAGFKQFLAQRWCSENLAFVEDVMSYQGAVARQDGEGVEGSVTALSVGKAIEDTFLTEGCPREVNIGDGMRAACLEMRARDVELGTASMDTFTPVVLELLDLVTPALQDFRASAHYAAIEACLNLGPRGARNSAATSGATHFDEVEEEEGGGEGERERRVDEDFEDEEEEEDFEDAEEEEEEEEEERARLWARRSSHVTE